MTKVVIIPFSLPWNWPADYEYQTAITLAKLGYKVIIYLDSEAKFFTKFNKIKYPDVSNITFFTPRYLLPFKRFKIIELINQFICVNYVSFKYGVGSKLILWLFNYKFSFFPKLFIKKSLSIYDCVELPVSRNKELNVKIQKADEELIKNSDYFFVDSPTLRKYFKKQKPIVVPQGFDILGFSKLTHKSLPLKLPEGLPIIGYIGGINYRLDYKLLDTLIRQNPMWNFIFVGNIQFWPSEDRGINTKVWISRLKMHENFYLYDVLPKKYMKDLIDKFSVCLIPYNTKVKFNLYSRAMKTYEYLYLNKPVISTPIFESKRLNKYIMIKNSVQGFESAIRSALNKRNNSDNIKLLRTIFKNNSWGSKVNKILEIIKQ